MGLGALLLANALLGFSSSTGVGSFRMFTRLAEYHLAIISERSDGPHHWTPASLEPHLGRDARRVLLPMMVGTWTETHGRLAMGSVEQMASWACEADPDADFVTVRVIETRSKVTRREARIRCRG